MLSPREDSIHRLGDDPSEDIAHNQRCLSRLCEFEGELGDRGGWVRVVLIEIQLVRDSTQPFLKVTVPKGTKLSDTLRLQPQLSDILGKLKGCLPCNSGVPIWFHEREEIENLVKIDLATMKRL